MAEAGCGYTHSGRGRGQGQEQGPGPREGTQAASEALDVGVHSVPAGSHIRHAQEWRLNGDLAGWVQVHSLWGQLQVRLVVQASDRR